MFKLLVYNNCLHYDFNRYFYIKYINVNKLMLFLYNLNHFIFFIFLMLFQTIIIYFQMCYYLNNEFLFQVILMNLGYY